MLYIFLYILTCNIINASYEELAVSGLPPLQISYFSESAELSDRRRYKRYFRTNPSGIIEYPAFRSIMSHFGWKRIAILTQDENLFTNVGLRSYHCELSSILSFQAQAIIEEDLKAANYTVTSRVFETGSDPLTSDSDFFVSNILTPCINLNSDLNFIR